MPHYKPNRSLEGGIIDTGKPLPFRDEQVVDSVIGRRRKTPPSLGTGFYDWPLWQRYPTWQQFWELLAKEREAAAREGRAPHRAARPPMDTAYAADEEYVRAPYIGRGRREARFKNAIKGR